MSWKSALDYLVAKALESPITRFFRGSRVSHYPQFVKALGNSGVFTVKYNLQNLAIERGTEYGTGYRELAMSPSTSVLQGDHSL